MTTKYSTIFNCKTCNFSSNLENLHYDPYNKDRYCNECFKKFKQIEFENRLKQNKR